MGLLLFCWLFCLFQGQGYQISHGFPGSFIQRPEGGAAEPAVDSFESPAIFHGIEDPYLDGCFYPQVNGMLPMVRLGHIAALKGFLDFVEQRCKQIDCGSNRSTGTHRQCSQELFIKAVDKGFPRKSLTHALQTVQIV